MTTALVIARSALVWACCIAALSFVLRYSRRPWWLSLEGRHLMFFTLTVGATFFLMGLLPYLAMSREVKGVIAIVAYGSMLVALVQRHRLLSRADRDAREDAIAHSPRHEEE